MKSAMSDDADDPGEARAGERTIARPAPEFQVVWFPGERAAVESVVGGGFQNVRIFDFTIEIDWLVLSGVDGSQLRFHGAFARTPPRVGAAIDIILPGASQVLAKVTSVERLTVLRRRGSVQKLLVHVQQLDRTGARAVMRQMNPGPSRQ